MTTTRRYCTKHPITAERNDSLSTVAQRMRDHHVGCVVVVDRGPQGERLPVGLLTDRDIVVRVLAQTDRHLEQVCVADVMAQPVVSVKDTLDVAESLRIMRSAGVRRVPVTDATGALVGLLSFDDLLEYYEQQIVELATLLERERRHESSKLGASELGAGER
ncbi:MAG TPA: CBS domain-containing protein [Polyangiaceae bacterium]|nr:CBS domain-containing protein [Polyangiaceae bacterium]